jgi:putative transport protein
MDNQLSSNALLLLFTVAAIGYLVGSIKVRGASLGVAAVLFVGLGFGFSNPDYVVPEIIFQLGLVLFVYSVGLSSGHAFFHSFKRNGWRDIGFIIISLLVSALISVLAHFIFGFSGATTSGIYAGSSTNTTALAAVSDMMVTKSGDLNALLEGYTYAYPMGVLGVMIVLKVCEKIFKVDYKSDRQVLKYDYPIDIELSTRSIKVTNPNVFNRTMRDIVADRSWNVVFSRITRGQNISLVHYDTVFEQGDTLMVVGSPEDLDLAQADLGEVTEENQFYDRKVYDVQQIFVSNDKMVGRSIASLNLNGRFDTIITRIRRGDNEILAKPETVLELGDRIRFIARRADLKELAKMFGDSYYDSSRVNLFSFGLGMALGLLLGSIEFVLPGQLNFKLGYAGGPLIVGLCLGAIRRTGPLVWALPYSVNVTLRQLGLILLLAVVGLKGGHSFFESMTGSQGFKIFAAGSIVCILSTFLSVVIGLKIFKIPFSLLLGFMSNQPAILDFASDMSKNKAPTIGYTIMFPIGMIIKILISQVLYLML